MNICIDTRMLSNSGIGVYIKYICNALIKQPDYNIYTTTETEFKLKNLGIRNEDNLYNRIGKVIECPIKRFDLYWKPHYNMPILPIFASKHITTIHDLYHIAYEKEFTLKQKIHNKLLFLFTIKYSDIIITDSFFSKNEILKYGNISDSKIKVIHLAVDKNIFNLKPLNTDMIKEKYNLPEKYILFIGNIKKHKNLSRLIDAFSNLIISKKLDYSLVLVGKISKENQLTSNNKVIFTGAVEDEEIALFYKSASLFVFPSYYEGFGLPPLEAMASGCPTIVSHSASIPEVCRNATYYFDPFSKKDILSALTYTLLNNKVRLSLIEKGIENAKYFSWDKTVGMHISLINSICIKGLN